MWRMHNNTERGGKHSAVQFFVKFRVVRKVCKCYGTPDMIRQKNGAQFTEQFGGNFFLELMPTQFKAVHYPGRSTEILEGGKALTTPTFNW